MADNDLVYALELRLIDREDRLSKLETTAEPTNTIHDLELDVTSKIDNGTHPLRAHRQSKMLTQEALGQLSGLRANHISAIERGQGMRVKTARKLANALSVPVSTFLK